MKVILLHDNANEVIQFTINELNNHIEEWIDDKSAKEMYDRDVEFANQFNDIDWYLEEIPKCEDADLKRRWEIELSYGKKRIEEANRDIKIVVKENIEIYKNKIDIINKYILEYIDSGKTLLEPCFIPFEIDCNGGYPDNSPKKVYEYFFGSIYKKFIYNNKIYFVDGVQDEDKCKLLIMDSCDAERRKFERLKNKFSGNKEEKSNRQKIPESVRIEVWRRDQGCCALCGSRESLEYDHIIPVSRGGSNTARNIELLCEKCNRSKSNNIQ